MACKASTDPDIMYMYEATREKDKEQSILATQKEVDQMLNGNFTIVHKLEVPQGKVILPVRYKTKTNKEI